MKRESIRNHLRPYSIVNRRKTTINHAFASAIAPNDEYDEIQISEAILCLDQDPENDLVCAYCEENPADTWDHVYGLVKEQKYYGYGHTIGNLLPCCQHCNSSKGNKDWIDFIGEIIPDDEKRNRKIDQLQAYFTRFLGPRIGQDNIEKICPEEMRKLQDLRERVLSLLEEADEIAVSLRNKVRLHISRQDPSGDIKS